jgi:uncharacterized protein YndB with AHSA1/START domain
MSDLQHYTPGPANLAQVRNCKDENKRTLVLVRELRHPPERVWEALTDPAHLREWAPFVVDANLATTESVKLTWVGNPVPIDTKVKRAEPPHVLEYGDIRWELEPTAGGTRLTLWADIDRRFVSMGAAGWHIAYDVLDRLLGGNPIGRIAGAEAMKFEGWKRLNEEYAQQFGVKAPKWPPKADQKL